MGLRQGCSLSPILFNLYIDDAIRIWNRKLLQLGFSNDLNSDNFVMTLLFADDQVIVSNSDDILQRALFELQKIMEQYNLEISTNKTESMAFCGSSQVRCKLVVNNTTIRQVKQFKFLGCKLSPFLEADIKHKTETFNRICGTISRTLKNRARKETKLKFYKTMAIPAGLYGAESWVLTSKDKNRIQASEMRFLRSVVGVTRKDQVRNEDIRQSLKICSLNHKITKYRKNWKSHIERMDNDRIPKSIYKYQPNGFRRIGRPKKRWKDQEC